MWFHGGLRVQTVWNGANLCRIVQILRAELCGFWGGMLIRLATPTTGYAQMVYHAFPILLPRILNLSLRRIDFDLTLPTASPPLQRGFHTWAPLLQRGFLVCVYVYVYVCVPSVSHTCYSGVFHYM